MAEKNEYPSVDDRKAMGLSPFTFYAWELGR
jgi:hypothetical protein